MRRLLWLLAGLALVAAGLYLTGRPPAAYVLEQEGRRYQETRRTRYTYLAFQIARADEDARPELRRKVDDLLAETKRINIRGWEVVLVPPGARAPGMEYRKAAELDPSERSDPPALKGPMTAWIRPTGWLARLFSRR